jgi:hypothetical protein
MSQKTPNLPSAQAVMEGATDLMEQAAAANVGEVGGNNKGEMVAKMLAVCLILFPTFWCAACVTFYQLKSLANLLGRQYNKVTIVAVLIKLRPLLAAHYALPNASCGKKIAWGKERGIYRDRDEVDLKNLTRGWEVFFDTETDKRGRWKRAKPRVATHIGLATGRGTETVEGNTSDKDRADGDGMAVKPRDPSRIVGVNVTC